MRLLRSVLSVALVGVTAVSGVWAQSTYSPGQTFTAGQAPAQTPVAQPRPEVNLPVYAPQQVQPSPQTRQQPRRVQSTPLYNMSAAQRRTDAQAEARSTEKSASKSRSEPSKSKSSAASAGKKAAADEGNKEKEPVKTTAKAASEPAKSAPVKAEAPEEKKTEAAAELGSADEPSASKKVDSNDKLVFTNRKTGEKLIALTYDDGPNPSFTPRLVEYLKANNVPATFYLCGNMVKEYPDLVKQLAAEGFELANHSYDHPNLQKLSREKVLEQLQDTHDLIKEHAGVDVKTMRPPYGAMNSTVKDVCEAMGYKIILWDVDTEDWRKRSTAQMMNTISKLTGDGSIILMHDRKHGGKDTVLETTKQTVDKYRAQGYRFVTVTELLGLNGNAAVQQAPADAQVSGASTTTGTLAIPGPVTGVTAANPLAVPPGSGSAEILP